MRSLGLYGLLLLLVSVACQDEALPLDASTPRALVTRAERVERSLSWFADPSAQPVRLERLGAPEPTSERSYVGFADLGEAESIVVASDGTGGPILAEVTLSTPPTARVLLSGEAIRRVVPSRDDPRCFAAFSETKLWRGCSGEPLSAPTLYPEGSRLRSWGEPIYFSQLERTLLLLEDNMYRLGHLDEARWDAPLQGTPTLGLPSGHYLVNEHNIGPYRARHVLRGSETLWTPAPGTYVWGTSDMWLAFYSSTTHGTLLQAVFPLPDGDVRVVDLGDRSFTAPMIALGSRILHLDPSTDGLVAFDPRTGSEVTLLSSSYGSDIELRGVGGGIVQVSQTRGPVNHIYRSETNRLEPVSLELGYALSSHDPRTQRLFATNLRIHRVLSPDGSDSGPRVGYPIPVGRGHVVLGRNLLTRLERIPLEATVPPPSILLESETAEAYERLSYIASEGTLETFTGNAVGVDYRRHRITLDGFTHEALERHERPWLAVGAGWRYEVIRGQLWAHPSRDGASVALGSAAVGEVESHGGALAVTRRTDVHLVALDDPTKQVTLPHRALDVAWDGTRGRLAVVHDAGVASFDPVSGDLTEERTWPSGHYAGARIFPEGRRFELWTSAVEGRFIAPIEGAEVPLRLLSLPGNLIQDRSLDEHIRGARTPRWVSSGNRAVVGVGHLLHLDTLELTSFSDLNVETFGLAADGRTLLGTGQPYPTPTVQLVAWDTERPEQPPSVLAEIPAGDGLPVAYWSPDGRFLVLTHGLGSSAYLIEPLADAPTPRLLGERVYDLLFTEEALYYYDADASDGHGRILRQSYTEDAPTLVASDTHARPLFAFE